MRPGADDRRRLWLAAEPEERAVHLPRPRQLPPGARPGLAPRVFAHRRCALPQQGPPAAHSSKGSQGGRGASAQHAAQLRPRRSAAIFWSRGIARPATGEISSLSCEEAGGEAGRALWVVLFEVPATPASVAAFTEREHEFRFVAVQPVGESGAPDRMAARPARCAHNLGAVLPWHCLVQAQPRAAPWRPRQSAPARADRRRRRAPQVLCAAWSDEAYRARRCPPAEWQARYGRLGIDRVWRCDRRRSASVCFAAAQRTPRGGHAGRRAGWRCWPGARAVRWAGGVRKGAV